MALLGRPVPGLWQFIERRGEKWYLNYCVNKGVPSAEAQERLSVGEDRLLLSQPVKQQLEAGDVDN